MADIQRKCHYRENYFMPPYLLLGSVSYYVADNITSKASYICVNILTEGIMDLAQPEQSR
jgi:hypothetical protein